MRRLNSRTSNHHRVRTYRLVLDPIANRDGHRLVRDLPRDKVRKILQEIWWHSPRDGKSDAEGASRRYALRGR